MPNDNMASASRKYAMEVLKNRTKLATFIMFAISFAWVIVVFNVFAVGMFRVLSEPAPCYWLDSTPDSITEFGDDDYERLSDGDGRNIFFHETSCFERTGFIDLGCRQACAVESAALMNPNMSVHLFFLSPSPPSVSTAVLLEKLHQYNNVHVRRLKISDYIKHTRVERWFNQGEVLKDSYHPAAHMNDILKFVSLWKYGGIYLDLDVVVTQSLEDLNSFSAAQHDGRLSTGAMGFGRDDNGRLMAGLCMREIIEERLGKYRLPWSSFSVGVLTRAQQRLCHFEDDPSLRRAVCNTFKVFPPPAFFPIDYHDWKLYFKTENSNSTMELIKETRAIHVFNRLSENKLENLMDYFSAEVPYLQVAKKQCPLIYNSCISHF